MQIFFFFSNAKLSQAALLRGKNVVSPKANRLHEGKKSDRLYNTMQRQPNAIRFRNRKLGWELLVESRLQMITRSFFFSLSASNAMSAKSVCSIQLKLVANDVHCERAFYE